MSKNTYDVTITVNLTLEYDDPQTEQDVEDDARDAFEYYDTYGYNGGHVWVCDVTTGTVGVVDGELAEPDTEYPSGREL